MRAGAFRGEGLPTAPPTLLSLAACPLCGSKFRAMQRDGDKGKRQEAHAKTAVEAEEEANAKSNGRCKSGHGFLNRF